MRILVTGGTGMLGTELVPRLVQRGHEVYVLTRHPGRALPGGPHYIKGDVTKPHLDALDFTQKLDAVVHLAALTSLRRRNAPDTNLVNYVGTQNVVYFCLARQVPALFHVSTLYVCGDHTSTFSESDFDVKQGFKNPYEESKYNAEGFVRNHPVLDVTIFRPGVLVGRHPDGHSAVFEGFYRPMRAILAAHAFAERNLGLPKREEMEKMLHLPPLKLPIRIYGDPDSTIALTPVDWAAEKMAESISRYSTAYSRRPTEVLHIAPSSPPTMGQVIESVCSALGIQGMHVDPNPTRNPLDIFYNRLIQDFHPYAKAQPAFSTSVGHTCPPVDSDYIKRIVMYWRAHDERPLEQEVVSADLRAS